MAIESDNLKDEIKELVEGCIKCGFCRSLCPVLRIAREEYYSPRARAVMLDNEFVDKIIYDCTLCKACEYMCPVNLKLCSAFIKARTVLVNQKKEINEAKEIIKNLNKTGNIYGIKEE